MPKPPLMPRRRLLGCWAGAAAASLLPVSGWARSGAPAFLLATDAPAEVDPSGYLVSEKFDGVRAFWDGRQLCLRGGTPVATPVWFSAGLPTVALDGELWLGRGRFDAVSGLVRSGRVDAPAWRTVRYLVFELPAAPGSFAQRARRLQELALASPPGPWEAIAQSTLRDQAALRSCLAQVVDAGGEGLMLHRVDAPYVTGRSSVLLKLKPLHDADAVVLAHLPGRGRHQGRLGALLVRSDNGTIFRLGTGLSDALRQAPPPVGAMLTYTHRGHTSNGLPRFASFLRLRHVEG
jgi:DNA ligase-1